MKTLQEIARECAEKIYPCPQAEWSEGAKQANADSQKRIQDLVLTALQSAQPGANGEDSERLKIPIDEQSLLLLGFVIEGDEFGKDQYRFSLTVEDASPNEWAAIMVRRGNGTDRDCWDVRFGRQDGNRMRPPDRVTLRYGARKIGEIVYLIRALDFDAARTDDGTVVRTNHLDPDLDIV